MWCCLNFPAVLIWLQGACVDEVRPATTVSYVAAADRLNEQCKKWADEMDSLLQQTLGSGKKRLAWKRRIINMLSPCNNAVMRYWTHNA